MVPSFNKSILFLIVVELIAVYSIRINYSVIGWVFLCLSVMSCNSENDHRKPNVLLIFADDIGSGDISHYNDQLGLESVVRTPNIDKIAAKGMTFTNAHSAASLCAPSRYAVMTGNYPFRSARPGGVWSSYHKSVIGPNDLTLARLMENSDYNTAFFGKWHLGGQFNSKNDSTKIYKINKNKEQETLPDITQIVGSDPIELGFDYNFYSPAGIQGPPFAMYENSKWYPLGEDSKIVPLTWLDIISPEERLHQGHSRGGLGDSNWSPESFGPLLAKKAVEFIKRTAGDINPFFMYYSSQAVHLPHTPGFISNDTLIHNKYTSDHLNMIMELDEQVGMLVDELKNNNLYDNTLIIFTSDNGGLEIPESRSLGHEANSIYRGQKGSIYEGGHRVPLIVSWPGQVKPISESNQIVVATDIMATLASLTNQSDILKKLTDSHDLKPLLQGRKGFTRQNALIRDNKSKKDSYYIDDWKLIVHRKKQRPLELYNLDTDIHERINLSKSDPDLVKKMLSEYKSFVTGY